MHCTIRSIITPPRLFQTFAPNARIDHALKDVTDKGSSAEVGTVVDVLLLDYVNVSLFDKQDLTAR